MITLREKKEHGTPSVPVVPYEPWMGRERGHHATVETHWHDEWEICYIETGRIECTLNGEICPMEAGDAVFIPGGILHSMKPVDGCHWIFESVVFNPSLLELNSDMFGESKYIGRFRTESNRRAAIFRDAAFNERYLRMYSALNEKVPFYELLVRAGLFELTAYWMEHSMQDGETAVKETRQDAVKQALDTIHGHYREKITLESLAADAGLSVGYFIRTFRRYVGKSPADYILNYRLTKAAELLRTTDQKILSVAFDTGFNNVSYFIRTFGKAYRCPPTAYRETFRREGTER